VKNEVEKLRSNQQGGLEPQGAEVRPASELFLLLGPFYAASHFGAPFPSASVTVITDNDMCARGRCGRDEKPASKV